MSPLIFIFPALAFFLLLCACHFLFYFVVSVLEEQESSPPFLPPSPCTVPSFSPDHHRLSSRSVRATAAASRYHCYRGSVKGSVNLAYMLFFFYVLFVFHLTISVDASAVREKNKIRVVTKPQGTNTFFFLCEVCDSARSRDFRQHSKPAALFSLHVLIYIFLLFSHSLSCRC